MSALAEEPPRRISSFSPQVSQENGDRKPSLRELPSYRKEANQALNRREDLKSLSQVCDGFFEFDTKKFLSQLEFFMSEGKIPWPNSLGWNF